MRRLFAACAGLALGGFATAIAQPGPSRLPGSPYPATARPDTLYTVSDGSWTAGQRIVVGALQGLLARVKPRIYRLPTARYSAWLSDLESRHGIRVDRTYQGDFTGLLRRFRGEIRGYLLYEPGTPSLRAALSLAASTGGLPASPDLVSTFESLGLPLLLDVRGQDEDWVLSRPGAGLSRKSLVYVRDQEAPKLADWSAFAGALHLYAPVEGPLARRALERMEPHAVLFGWGPEEFPLVATASSHGVHVHPADHAFNLSTLSQFDVPLRQRPAPADTAGTQGTHTVCFLMSDGDNVQWMLGDFSAPSWYGNPNRGQVNLGWTAPPSMAELAPTVLDALYRTASTAPGRDAFVAGPSGYGYIFPDRLAVPDSAAVMTALYMAKSDMRILNVIGAGNATAHLAPFLRRTEIDAVFYYPFSDYSGLGGSITFLENKPVIGGYANLWSGFETTASLAAKLNARPRDPGSKDGYSLIPVHVWSNTVDSVVRCASLLDSKVRVVAPDEFVRLIRAHLGPVTGIRSNPAGLRGADGPRRHCYLPFSRRGPCGIAISGRRVGR
jgi:hypothetical protein